MKTALIAYRNYLNLLWKVAPEKARDISFKRFATPAPVPVREGERRAMDKALTDTVTVEGHPTVRYRWGQSDRKILLVHGWSGNGGSLGYFTDPLAAKGYETVSFDGPAHNGHPLKQSNLFDFSKTVYEFIRLEKPETIVAHSFGCAASVMALHDHAREHGVKNLVLMGTPNKLTDIIGDFTGLLRFSDKSRIRFFNHISERFGRSVYSVRLDEYLTYSNMERTLVIHDYADRVVPYANAVDIKKHNPQTELMTLEKVGHYKMLWDARVLERVMGFIESKK